MRARCAREFRAASRRHPYLRRARQRQCCAQLDDRALPWGSGAVELRAAAVERREEAVRLREIELEHRAAELTELARQLDELGRTLEGSGARRVVREDEHVVLATAERYRLVVRPGPAPEPGEVVELEDRSYRCARITASPFPRDNRSCAVLEPLPPPVEE